MVHSRLYCTLAAVMVLMPLYACTEGIPGSKETSFTQEPGIREIKPQQPVNIKLKRSVTGKYSWALKGDDAEKVLETDRILRDGLK